MSARRSALVSAAAASLTLAIAWNARATAPMLFGYGPRSTSLAQSDLADPTPSAAAYTNAAFLYEPGTRVAIGYGHGITHLKLGGQPTGIRDIAGTDVAMQIGGDIGKGFKLGGGMALHLPDRSLGRIAFYPGTEPQFVRFEPAPQRLTADMALAIRYGAVSIGAGATTFVDAAGDGIAFKLDQDGNGPYADGSADLKMPYHVVPIAAAAVDLGPAALAMRYRGGQSIDLDLTTVAKVSVTGNPLNGTTTVRVIGANGYIPPTIDLGARYTLAPWLKAMVSIELALWSQAPTPAANLQMNVGLGLKPGLLETEFVSPRMRDTLSPRVGIEALPLGRDTKLAVRGGYMLSPSPVPRQTGFTTHADGTVHAFALGAGYDLGKAWGVAMRADASGMLMVMPERTFNKPSEVLPFAHYTASGTIVHASVAIEGAWK